MIGSMRIMIYMLAVYLVYKGVEILQIASMSSRENRTFGIAVGILCVIGAVIAGLAFSVWADTVAQSVGDRMNQIPGITR